MSHKLVVSTCPASEAEGLARALLTERLIACANLLPGARSLYWWEGALDDAEETVLLMKTAEDRVDVLIERLRALHSYDVPEILVLPVERGNPGYLDWVTAETRPVPG